MDFSVILILNWQTEDWEKTGALEWTLRPDRSHRQHVLLDLEHRERHRTSGRHRKLHIDVNLEENEHVEEENENATEAEENENAAEAEENEKVEEAEENEKVAEAEENEKVDETEENENAAEAEENEDEGSSAVKDVLLMSTWRTASEVNWLHFHQDELINCCQMLCRSIYRSMYIRCALVQNLCIRLLLHVLNNLRIFSTLKEVNGYATQRQMILTRGYPFSRISLQNQYMTDSFSPFSQV